MVYNGVVFHQKLESLFWEECYSEPDIPSVQSTPLASSESHIELNFDLEESPQLEMLSYYLCNVVQSNVNPAVGEYCCHECSILLCAASLLTVMDF